MKSIETIERRSETLNDVLIRVGKLEKGQEVLETTESQRQQWQNNHRAETLGLVEKVEGRVLEIIKPLISDVNAIKRLIWMGGGGFGTVMFGLELYRTFSGR